MSNLELLQKRKEELKSTIVILNELIEKRTKSLITVEKLAFKRILDGKYTLLNIDTNKEIKKNFVITAHKSLELETKMRRRCIFFLRKRRYFLEDRILQVESEMQEYIENFNDLNQNEDNGSSNHET